MKKLELILQNKGKKIIQASPDSTVYEALGIMMEFNISAILITEGNKLKGIFTERDYARKVVLKGKSSKEVKLREVMTPTPLTVTPDDSVEFCMETMTEKHIRHLPVVENGEPTGMISIGDVVKFVIEDQKHTIRSLENYISS